MRPNPIRQHSVDFFGPAPTVANTAAAVNNPEHDSIPNTARPIDFDLLLALHPLDVAGDDPHDRSGVGIRADLAAEEARWRRLHDRANVRLD
jgi:hypothetical protein